MRVSTKTVITGVLVTGIVILSVATVLIGLIRRPIRYEITEPFQGWVTVIYEDSNCKPLEEDGFFLVVHVDGTGKGCTSSPMPQGWRYLKFVYVGKDGKRTTLVHSNWAKEQSRRIWAGATMSRNGGYSQEGEIFFVGTAEQLKGAWSRQPVP